MKIARIRLYRQFQPFRDGPYTCSGDRTAPGFDSAIVAIDAATVHLSLSTPEQYRLHTVDFHNWVTIGHGEGIPATRDGLMFPPIGPGLGIAIRDNDLGDPIFETQ